MNEPYSEQLIQHLRERLVERVAEAAQARTDYDEVRDSLPILRDVMQACDGRVAELRRLLRAVDPQNAEKYADPEPVAPAVPAVLPPLAVGLREAADLIEAHPELGVHTQAHLQVCPQGTDAEELNTVNRLAPLLGVEPKWEAGDRHYVARLTLPGALEFQAVAIPAHPRTVVAAPLKSAWHETPGGDFHGGAQADCGLCVAAAPVEGQAECLDERDDGHAAEDPSPDAQPPGEQAHAPSPYGGRLFAPPPEQPVAPWTPADDVQPRGWLK